MDIFLKNKEIFKTNVKKKIHFFRKVYFQNLRFLKKLVKPDDTAP